MSYDKFEKYVQQKQIIIQIMKTGKILKPQSKNNIFKSVMLKCLKENYLLLSNGEPLKFVMDMLMLNSSEEKYWKMGPQ